MAIFKLFFTISFLCLKHSLGVYYHQRVQTRLIMTKSTACVRHGQTLLLLLATKGRCASGAQRTASYKSRKPGDHQGKVSR